MTDTSSNPTQGQWGRPTKRKIKYAAPKAREAAPPVGPVDDPELLARAAVIVHAERPVHVPAPASSSRAPREPDDGDFRMRDLVGEMARGLVDHPDDVVVEIISAGADGVLELHVNPDDLGHVIGKQGRTARSLRLTLGAAAARIDRRVDLEIAD